MAHGKVLEITPLNSRNSGDTVSGSNMSVGALVVELHAKENK